MSISVLLVDDSEALCQYLSELLKSYGVNYVEYCLNGESALTKVERNPALWDAIFVDLHMEGMDGLQLMHSLSELRYRGGVVVMSALDQKILDFTGEVISKYSLRVLGSMHKPFEETTVAFLVKRIQNFHTNGVCPSENLLKRREVQVALEQKRLVPYFQPIVYPTLSKLISLECLIRLDIDGRGTILPSAFIPVAERFNLLSMMTLSTLDAVLPQFKFFLVKTKTQCTLAINLSPIQLLDESLPDVLFECVQSHGLLPEQIIFEITENEPIRATVQNKNLNRLRIKGFGLALDDFGAGYTNLRQIKNVPYTEIKLDRQMVDGVSRDRVLAVIAKSVLNLTHELGIKLVAEGVENPADLAFLNDIGVEYFQGYLFCRPKPLGELIRWYQAWGKVAADFNEQPISPRGRR